MQFGINKHEEIFQRLTKLHEPVGRVQFGVFEKFTSAYLLQIAQQKSCDYLIIYMEKFRNGKTKETHVHHTIREKLRHQLRHPGRALDLKTKDLIGHL